METKSPKLKEYYSPKEAAPLLTVSYWTVLRMIARGDIKAISLPNEHYRIPRGEISRIMYLPANGC